jgi:hypothetical protein
MKKLVVLLCILGLLVSAQVALAAPVDLEMILAIDVSGSVDGTDFALRRSGIEDAFRNPLVISAIEDGAIGSIAVTMWDFANAVAVAVDWTQISNAAESNAFADDVAAAPRGFIGGGDGQSNMITQAATAINTNAFEGRAVLDIVSEGAQDIDGCTFDNVVCLAVQAARDNFLAAGGDAINALWMNDRDFFGLDPTDLINAFEYGSLNVIAGAGSFQVFAETNADFIEAIDDKIIREITAPEPGTMLLICTGLLGLVGFRRKFRK